MDDYPLYYSLIFALLFLILYITLGVVAYYTPTVNREDLCECLIGETREKAENTLQELNQRYMIVREDNKHYLTSEPGIHLEVVKDVVVSAYVP